MDAISGRIYSEEYTVIITFKTALYIVGTGTSTDLIKIN